MVKSSKSDQLYLQLRRRISAMKDGEPFPTVRQLMTEYQVSQSTVTPAINQLKEKGLIEAYVGRGSFVSKKDAGKPHMLLLQHNWPAPILPFMAERLRRAAEEDGFRFEHRIYDYHDDITLTLSNYEADIIVVDGIADDLMTPEQILAISRCPAPVILSRNSVPISQINYVCGDNAAAGVNIANYLFRHGHRKFGLLINEPHLYTVEAFCRGFESCAASNGCSVEVLDCRIRPGERPHRQVAEFMKAYAAGKYDFTALFPISCDGAIQARRYLEEYGVRVPEDLSIISTGTVPRVEWLTAVDSGAEEYSGIIVRMAIDILNHDSQYRRQIEFPQKLIESSSVRNLNESAALSHKNVAERFAAAQYEKTVQAHNS